MTENSPLDRRRAFLAPLPEVVHPVNASEGFARSNLHTDAQAFAGGSLMQSSVLFSGYVQKRREKSGFHSYRWLEVKPGFLYWYKGNSFSSNAESNCRFLPGSSFVGQVDDTTKGGAFQATITIYVSHRPNDKQQPLIFILDSEDKYTELLLALQRGANWQNYRKVLPMNGGVRDRLCGLLVVDIVRGENLMVADWGGTSDPYVIAGFDEVYGRTKTIFKTLSPEFDERITIPIFHDNPNWNLGFYVFDADEVSGDDLLGISCLPLFALGMNTEKIWRLPLKSEKRGSEKVDLGCITIRTYYHTSAFVQGLPIPERKQPASLSHVVETFALDVFKQQISRINKAVKVFRALGVFSEVITFKRPSVTFSIYLGISIVTLFLSEYFLLLVLISIGYMFLMSHQEYSNLYKRLLRPLGMTFLAPFHSNKHQQVVDLNASRPSKESSSPKLSPLNRTNNHSLADSLNSKSPVHMKDAPSDLEVTDSSSGDELLKEENIIRVYECQRRNVAATAAAIWSRDIVGDANSVFKKTFSYKFLKANESRWLSYGADPMLEPPKTVQKGYKYSWRVHVESKKTDNNGWEYANKWPDHLHWHKHKFRQSFLPHLHWVRRRLWVGVPFREANEADVERPIDEAADTHEAHNEDFDDVTATAKSMDNKGLMAKYRKLLDEGGRYQGKVYDIANIFEDVVNLPSWKNPRVTGLFFMLIISGILAASILPQRIVAW